MTSYHHITAALFLVVLAVAGAYALTALETRYALEDRT